MNAQLRSELLKLRSARTTGLLVLWMLGLVLLIVLLHVFSLGVAELTTHEGQMKVLGWGTVIGALFAALLGAISITGELRHGTIRPTLLVTPDRRMVMAAKVVACGLAGIGLGLLAEALTAVLETIGLAARGIEAQLTAGDYVQLLLGGAVAAGFFAAIGVGLGAIVRNQVGTIIGLCLWLLVIETSLLGGLAAVGKFAPGAGAGAIAGAIQTQTASQLVAPAVGALLLVVYAGVAAAGGTVVMSRRDVN